MRITRIHLKNLNSLAGEWSIDLDRSEYAGEGIFAITGPHGSGQKAPYSTRYVWRSMVRLPGWDA